MWAITGFLILPFVMMVSAQNCSQGVNPRCGSPVDRGINSSDMATLLNVHNNLRKQVAQGNEKRGNPGPQPKASDMKTMQWDTALAAEAQRWADQCTWGHGFCSTDSRISKGQNLYAVMSSSSSVAKMNYTAAVMSWYNEVVYFNKANIKPFKFNSDNGHYTQLLWANSSSIGCGRTKYKNSNDNLYWNTLVCDYSPAGNIIGGTMYTAA